MVSPSATAEGFVDAFLDALRSDRPATKEGVHRLKVRLARSRGIGPLPSDAVILEDARGRVDSVIEDLLRVKPARTASGVAVVTVMTAPHACPHGVCVFCPGGPRVSTPQSYTGHEAVTKRAAERGYDPRAQTLGRLEALRRIGHRTDKIDLIILGGTFTALDAAYRESFVKGCLDAMNGFSSNSLGAAQSANESASVRCVGLTMETKPDVFLGAEVEHSLALGVTRVELGLQSTHDDVLALAHRGHTDGESRLAILRSKEAGLKVGVHLMLGLPGSDAGRDFASARSLFEDPAYRPDFLKIYPTLVLEGTALHGLAKAGRYTPLRLEDTVDLLSRIKALVPPWCRIQRIQREIGAPQILGGPRRGDLRVLAQERLRSRGLRCRCVRCREVGLRAVEPRAQALTLLRADYDASGGREVFLSVEDPGRDVLVGYARLRIDAAGATLRELKVFGRLVPLHEPSGGRWQHRGLGRRLVSEAERLAREAFGARRMRVTAGVGVRGYYRRLGYDLEAPYMVRRL
jgi:elongator complex protein 3